MARKWRISTSVLSSVTKFDSVNQELHPIDRSMVVPPSIPSRLLVNKLPSNERRREEPIGKERRRRRANKRNANKHGRTRKKGNGKGEKQPISHKKSRKKNGNGFCKKNFDSVFSCAKIWTIRSMDCLGKRLRCIRVKKGEKGCRRSLPPLSDRNPRWVWGPASLFLLPGFRLVISPKGTLLGVFEIYATVELVVSPYTRPPFPNVLKNPSVVHAPKGAFAF